MDKISYIRTNILMLLVSTLGMAIFTLAHAKEDCPVASTQQISNAFADNNLQLLNSDPSGMCSWMMDGSQLFSMQITAQDSNKNAKLLYDTFRNSDVERLANSIKHKTIGQASSFNVSSPDAASNEVSLIILNNDRVVKITLYPKSPEFVNEQITNSMLKVGRLASENSSKADQQFGSCEWFPENDLDNLLGKKNRRVQRLGPNHCIASVQPGNASLVVMTDKNSTSTSFNNQKEGISRECKTVPLSEYGASTYAFYDCQNPGNKVMSVEFYQNGIALTLSYKPAGQPATLDDLERMKSVIRHVYNLLNKS
jgi:hypothetical protein